jgi:small-conductance mechanosensitive channel
MLSDWWDNLLSVLRHPIYGNIILAVIIILIAWGLTRIVRVIIIRWSKIIEARAGTESPIIMSPAKTRLAMLRRITYFLIYFLAAMFILLQIPQVRSIGTTLLATAGVIGIVAGLAGQATLSNIIAGVSLAFSQPVRLNDAVIYEGDWGWVEEITLMHTIIRTWDNRRLIVPNNVLNSTVIQNWTIKDQWLLGIVMMYVDYTCDVEQVRKWAKEIVGSSSYSTDERIAVTEVVDFTEKSMVLRILGKSWDSSNTWNLRCEIREKLINKFHEAGLPLPEIRIGQTQAEARRD